MEQKNLFKSLAAFQQSVPVIYKDTQAYGYKYADLPAIFEVINPLMKKNGLGFTQLIENYTVKTIVFHIESGETIESSTPIPQGVQLKGMNDFQILGSAITYIRRYALSSILGIITDKDTDASGEQVKKQLEKIEKPFISVDIFNKMIKSTDILAIKEYCNKVQLTPEQAEQVKNHINTLK